jgi:hypothetical protein
MGKLKQISVPGVEGFNSIDKIRLVRDVQQKVVEPYVVHKTGQPLGAATISYKPEDDSVVVTDPAGHFVYFVTFKGDKVRFMMPLPERDADYFLGMIGGAIKALLPVGTKLLKSVVGRKNAKSIDRISGAIAGASDVLQGNYLKGVGKVAQAVLNKTKPVERVKTGQSVIGSAPVKRSTIERKEVEKILRKETPLIAPIAKEVSHVLTPEINSGSLDELLNDVKEVSNYSDALKQSLESMMKDIRSNHNVRPALQRLLSLGV